MVCSWPIWDNTWIIHRTTTSLRTGYLRGRGVRVSRRSTLRRATGTRQVKSSQWDEAREPIADSTRARDARERRDGR
eukprot:2162941-Prymnesium_polylepis.1